MSLTPPSASNNYQVTDDHSQSPELWNSVMASLAQRLADVEAAASGFEDAVSNAAIATAQAILENTITPQLDNVQTVLAALEASIALAEDRLAALQAGGVLAENVPVAAGGRYEPGTSAQEAFEQLDAALQAVEGAMPGISAAIAAVEPPQFVRSVAANTNLAVGHSYRVMAAGITLTLPAEPAAHQTIRIMDGGVLDYLNTATIARNGKTIMGKAEDLTLNMTGADLLIWYDGATWRLF